MIAIEDIQKIKKNRGGIARVELIFEHDIFSMPSHSPFSAHLQGSIQLKSGKRPYFIYFTSRSSQFQEVTNIKSDAGDFHTQSIAFRTPKDRPVVRTLIDRLRNNKVCIVYLDWNGQFKIVRNLRATPKLGTGVLGAYNGVEFSFAGSSRRPSGFWAFTDNPYINAPDIPNTEEPDTPIVITPPDDGNPPTDPPSSTGDCCIKTYTYSQNVASRQWVIPHDLNGDINRPTLISPNGYDLYSEDYIDRLHFNNDNTVTIDFKMPVSGAALITSFCDCQDCNIGTYTHCETSPRLIWSIPHDLNDDINRPTLISSNGYDLYSENLVKRISFTSSTLLEIEFKMPVSGCALVTTYHGDASGVV